MVTAKIWPISRLPLGFIGWREISFHFAEIKVFAMPRMGLLAGFLHPFPVIGCVAIGWTLRFQLVL